MEPLDDKDKIKYKIIGIIFLCLILFSTCSSAALTDIKFGRYQIADSQWDVNSCLNTNTCEIYYKDPGVMYKIPWTLGQWNWQPGQYVKFSLTGNASYPYEGKVYNSNNSLAGTIGTGKIVNIGPDYFFFVGNDENTGQLFSGSLGMNNNNGVIWTGTLNPTISEVDSYADLNYSTVPLAQGETATQTPNGGGGGGPPPLCCGGSAVAFNPNSQFVSRIAIFDSRARQDTNVIITQIGNNNSAVVNQTGTKNNYSEINVNGSNNITNTTQNSSTIASKNYIELDVIGNSNTINLTQTNSGSDKSILATVSNNSNTLTIQQNNNGNHYAEIILTGSNKSVNLTQSGNAAHMAKIELSGGTTSLTATQSGNIQQFYSITHNCAQISCAAITVTQGQ